MKEDSPYVSGKLLMYFASIYDSDWTWNEGFQVLGGHYNSSRQRLFLKCSLPALLNKGLAVGG